MKMCQFGAKSIFLLLPLLYPWNGAHADDESETTISVEDETYSTEHVTNVEGSTFMFPSNWQERCYNDRQWCKKFLDHLSSEGFLPIDYTPSLPSSVVSIGGFAAGNNTITLIRWLKSI